MATGSTNPPGATVITIKSPDDPFMTMKPEDTWKSTIKKKSNNLTEGDDALNADFRYQIGLLPDEEEGLSEAFKAHLGLAGLDGVNQISEMEMSVDWEKDETIVSFKFSKFAKTFQNGMNDQWMTDPLETPLLEKKHEIDRPASLAVWLAIQRYMGDAPAAPEILREAVPVMTKIYRTIEAYQHRRKSSVAEEPQKSGPEVEKFKVQKRSSIKKFLGAMSRSSDQKGKDRKNSTSKKQDSVENDAINTERGKEVADLLARIPAHDFDLVHFIVGHGILRRDMRDEIYCQICKQLTKNPSKESEKKGWILMSLCTGCFLPTDRFLNYLKCFIKMAPLEYKDSYAGYTKKMLRRTIANGTRYHPPNWLEYQACLMRKYVMLQVTFADSRTETLEADSATTAGELCTKLANKVGLKDQFGFSVYVCIFDKVSSLGSGYDHVMDAISECEQVVRAKGSREEDAPWRLFFRKELFSPWHDSSYDDVSTQLIYQQLVKGIKSREYRFKSDNDLAKYVAQIYYVENGGIIVAGKLQAALHNYLPSKCLQGDAKSRDQWTQLIMNSIEEQQLTQNKPAVQKVKEDMVIRASNRWYLQFSGLFEAFKITGPPLPKNDVVIAINHRGMYVMHEPFKVCMAMDYAMIIEIFCSRTTKVRGQSFSCVTLKGDEFTFMSPNAQNIANLVSTFLEGLRRRSKYAVGLQEFVMHGSVESNEPFSFRQGDTLEIVETEPDGAPKKHEWVVGRNERTGHKGMFPLDMVYVIPTMEKPSDSFFKLFATMTTQEAQTLPRRKGTVLLNQTISKTVKKKGKETAA